MPNNPLNLKWDWYKLIFYLVEYCLFFHEKIFALPDYVSTLVGMDIFFTGKLVLSAKHTLCLAMASNNEFLMSNFRLIQTEIAPNSGYLAHRI